MRLQKYLAHAGVCSRRAAERLIEDGRVRVNGRVVDRLGRKIDPERDRVEVDRKPVAAPSPDHLYFLLHKPRGVLTTLSDPEDRPTLRPFLRSLPARVYPVGRLDFNSEGLVLLTDDGDLARVLMHPSGKVPKRYEVKVRGCPSAETLERLAAGVRLDGRKTLPAGIGFLKRAPNAWIDVVLREGRNRQIRRMFERVGHPVVKLRRVEFGPLKLAGLAPGEMRPLESAEVERLKRAVDRAI